jgi:hypothetical protein
MFRPVHAAQCDGVGAILRNPTVVLLFCKSGNVGNTCISLLPSPLYRQLAKGLQIKGMLGSSDHKSIPMLPSTKQLQYEINFTS